MFQFLRQIILGLSDRLIFESYLNSPTPEIKLFNVVRYDGELAQILSLKEVAKAYKTQDSGEMIGKIFIYLK